MQGDYRQALQQQDEQQSLVMLTTPTPHNDLAEVQLDLLSSISQDDSCQQDFCQGAKETHSLPTGEQLGYASPPFITSQEFPDWMDASDDFDWTEPLNFDECFPQSIKKQEPSQIINPAAETPRYLTADEIFRIENDLMKEEIKQQQEKEQQEFYIQQEQVHWQNEELKKTLQHEQKITERQRIVYKPLEDFQHNDVQEILYQESPLSSPDTFTEEAASPSFIVSYPDNFDVANEAGQCASQTPSIISVPIADALIDQKPIIKTVGVSNIKFSEIKAETFNGFSSIISSSPYGFIAQKQPQKIVINLKKFSVPKIDVVSYKPEIAKPSGQTLKEVLTSGDADDFIRELVNLPRESGITGNQVICIADEASQSPSQSGCKDDSLPSFLLTPNSYSGNEQCPDSPSDSSMEFYDDDEIKKSARHRYSPYSSLEKKLRKKEQNRRAALRYREKKKDEEETVLSILKKEEDTQKSLQENFNSLQMEVKLMKKLLREMFIAKGKITK